MDRWINVDLLIDLQIDVLNILNTLLLIATYN